MCFLRGTTKCLVYLNQSLWVANASESDPPDSEILKTARSTLWVVVDFYSIDFALNCIRFPFGLLHWTASNCISSGYCLTNSYKSPAKETVSLNIFIEYFHRVFSLNIQFGSSGSIFICLSVRFSTFRPFHGSLQWKTHCNSPLVDVRYSNRKVSKCF